MKGVGQNESFRDAVMREWIDEQACRIQRLVRKFLGAKRRAMLAELRQQASTLSERETAATTLQARLFRGPNARRRHRRLSSIRMIQRYFRGFHVRRGQERVVRCFFLNFLIFLKRFFDLDCDMLILASNFHLFHFHFSGDLSVRWLDDPSQ